MKGISKHIASLSIFLLFYCSAYNQTNIISHADSLYNESVFDHAMWYVDSTKNISEKNAIKASYDFVPGALEYFHKRFGRQGPDIWMRTMIENNSDVAKELLLDIGEDFLYKKLIIAGATDTIRRTPNNLFSTTPKVYNRKIQFGINPHSQRFVYLQIPYSGLIFQHAEMTISDATIFRLKKDEVDEAHYSYYTFRVVFLSVIFFMLLLTLANYYWHQRKEFLFYALYICFVFLFFLYRYETVTDIHVLLSRFPSAQPYLNVTLTLAMYYWYFQFALKFLDFSKLWSGTWKLIKTGQLILLFSGILYVLILFVFQNEVPGNYLFLATRITVLLISAAALYVLFRSKNKISIYFACGSIFLMLGAAFAMIFSIFPRLSPSFNYFPIIYLQIGVILELMCFTGLLSYKTYLIEKEKETMQENLLEQMRINQSLQRQFTNELEARVEAQTSQIIEQQTALEHEKEKQMKLDFQKKYSEVELKLLRSQLNPHFYFNTLNNLYGLANMNADKLPDAILQLSDIMEYVIYECRKDRVLLEKELQFIGSYIDLERLRYEQHTRILFSIEGTPRSLLIAPMLLIQFIENAFKHGMEQDKSSNFMEVKIVINEQTLSFTCINSRKGSTRKGASGVGMENAARRLKMLYGLAYELDTVETESTYTVALVLKCESLSATR